MLTQMQSEIAHASRVSVLGELTASIAHEVSQPLTAIESNTEASLLWLQRSPPNINEVRELSARTAAEVQRAAEIIQRVRSMAVRSTPEFAEVSVNPLIEEAILFLRHELQRNEIETSLHLDAKLPEIIGDRIQLQQVIVNLVVNAVQAMTTAKLGMRRLDITTSMNPSDEVLIVVRDTGPGISDEIRDRLFESFFTTKSSGMGIGLTICRSIIEAHGGRISVANRADETEAEFSIVLPSSYQRKHPAS
jgi:C4-dicarboxylate-specific signal transduction histidine kinase